MAYYTYLLQCEGGNLYVGITTDLRRRFRQHRGELKGGARFTALRAPVGFAAAWETQDRAEATRLEYRLKRLSHPEKLRAVGEREPSYEWLKIGTRVTEEALRRAEGQQEGASARETEP